MAAQKRLSKIVLLLFAITILTAVAGCASKASVKKTGDNINRFERAEKLVRSYYSYAGKNVAWESFKITDLQDYENGFLAVARYDNSEGNPCAVLIKAELNKENRYILRSFAENNYGSGKRFGIGLAIDEGKSILYGTAFDNPKSGMPLKENNRINTVRLVTKNGNSFDYKLETKNGFVKVLTDTEVSSVILSSGKDKTVFRKQDIPVTRMVDPRTQITYENHLK